MTDMPVEVPFMCQEYECTKSFGHELDPNDAEHGDGMYKILVHLENVMVKQWVLGRYETRPYMWVKLSDQQAEMLAANGWTTVKGNQTESVFGAPCWVLKVYGRILTSNHNVIGPYDILVRGLNWTFDTGKRTLTGRNAFVVDASVCLIEQVP